MALRLFLVRHGETVWNAEDRCQGFSDIELNERGRQQAEALARVFASEPLAAVYSSTLGRSLETARLIAQPHHLKVEADERLKELNQGQFEGLTFQEIRANHSAFIRQWREHPAHLRMPGGETLAELQARAWSFMEEVRQRHQGGAILAVSHNLTILTILCKLLGMDLESFRRLRQDVGASTAIDFTPLGPVLVRMNDTSHLNARL